MNKDKLLTLRILPEDDWYRASCVELGVSATGFTPSEAQRNLAYIMKSASAYLVRHRFNGLRPEQKNRVPFAQAVKNCENEQDILELFAKPVVQD